MPFAALLPIQGRSAPNFRGRFRVPLTRRAPAARASQANEIVESFRDEIVAFHTAVDGRLVSVHTLINNIAVANNKPPMPPPAIAFLVELKQDQKTGPDGPIITEEQLIGAFKKLVPAKDDKQVFEDKVVTHIREATERLKYVAKVYPEIKGALTDFHKKIGGNSDRLYQWFCDLLPDGTNVPKQAFLGMMMRVPPTMETVPLQAFLAGVRDNMDEKDTADRFIEVCEKHACQAC